jgi:hypothetical protein
MNVKLRRALDKLGWPLVTRARYQLNKDNYEAEIKQLHVTIDLRNEQLRQAQHRNEVQAQLIEQLRKSRYYNVRGADGRFTKKPATV